MELVAHLDEQMTALVPAPRITQDVEIDGVVLTVPFTLSAPKTTLSKEENDARNVFLKAMAQRGGRPRSDLLTTEAHWYELERLLKMQCGIREIAGFFNVDKETLAKRVEEVTGIPYGEYAAMVKPTGLIPLRRKQLEVAMKGNPVLLKHLGAHLLGQTTNRSEQTIRTVDADGNPIAAPKTQTENVVDVVLETLEKMATRRSLAQGAAADAAPNHALRKVVAGKSEKAKRLVAGLTEVMPPAPLEPDEETDPSDR